MSIYAIFGIGVVACALSLVLKKWHPEFSLFISLGAGLVIFFIVLSRTGTVITLVESVLSKTNLPLSYGKILIKSLGVCFVAQLAGDTCRDCGESAIAAKVDLAGKTAVLIMAVPLFEQLIETISKLLI